MSRKLNGSRPWSIVLRQINRNQGARTTTNQIPFSRRAYALKTKRSERNEPSRVHIQPCTGVARARPTHGEGLQALRSFSWHLATDKHRMRTSPIALVVCEFFSKHRLHMLPCWLGTSSTPAGLGTRCVEATAGLVRARGTAEGDETTCMAPQCLSWPSAWRVVLPAARRVIDRVDSSSLRPAPYTHEEVGDLDKINPNLKLF
jgi:hypothetical protein